MGVSDVTLRRKDLTKTHYSDHVEINAGGRGTVRRESGVGT